MENAVDTLLDKIRLNCIYLTDKHINNFLYHKGASVWFEIPTIILSVFAGSSMIITILTSKKIFMKINENQQQEQELAVQFKTLALDIFKILSLPEKDRGIDGLR